MVFLLLNVYGMAVRMQRTTGCLEVRYERGLMFWPAADFIPGGLGAS
jgi:hypothetical protein